MSFFRKIFKIVHAPLLLPVVTTLAVGAIAYRAVQNRRQPQEQQSAQMQQPFEQAQTVSGSANTGLDEKVTIQPNERQGSAYTPRHVEHLTDGIRQETGVADPQRLTGRPVGSSEGSNSKTVRMIVLPRDTTGIYDRPIRQPAQVDAVGSMAQQVQVRAAGSEQDSAGARTAR